MPGRQDREAAGRPWATSKVQLTKSKDWRAFEVQTSGLACGMEEEYSWWDQLLAPFGGNGGCCDARDAPVRHQRNTFSCLWNVHMALPSCLLDARVRKAIKRDVRLPNCAMQRNSQVRCHAEQDRGSYDREKHANRSHPMPLAFVPESTPERTTTLAYREQMRLKVEEETARKMRMYVHVSVQFKSTFIFPVA